MSTTSWALKFACVAALAMKLSACGSEDVELDDDDVDWSQSSLIIGDDNRLRVPDALKTSTPYRNIVAVRADPYTAYASCSAFKVGPRHLLSAAHCFTAPSGSGAALLPVGNFRLVYGQYGSGNNVANNFPVVDHKVPVESVYIPAGYLSNRAQVDDWALVRVPNNESTAGWFRAITPLTTTQINEDFVGRYTAGYPLDLAPTTPVDPQKVCADAPSGTNSRCGGYQYYSTFQGPFTFTTSFIATQSDWGQGQSGGPAYGAMPGVSQYVTIGIIAYSGASTSYVRRLTTDITNKLCEQVRAFPSTSYPTHECGP